MNPSGAPDRLAAEQVEQATEAIRASRRDRDPYQLLAWAAELFEHRLMMSTAFGKSGMCILHMVKEVCPQVPVYFLDTGFHFPETLEFLDTLRSQWNVQIIAQRPEIFGVDFVRKFGEKLHDTDPDLCCHKNKVEPFRALFGDRGKYQAWIAGVRRDQSSTRAHAEPIELMEGNLVKIQPMALWTRSDVEDYLSEHSIPLHPLFAKGYPSIGCAPCTRPASDPRDERSGRWANKAKTECGLHTFWQKKAESAKDAPDAGGESAEARANAEAGANAETRANAGTGAKDPTDASSGADARSAAP